MAISLKTRRLLAEVLSELAVEPEQLEAHLRSGGNLLELFPDDLESRERLKAVLRRVMPDDFLDISPEEVPAWRTRLFLVERDYALFSLGEEEVGALIPRFPFEEVQAEIEEGNGSLVRPFLVLPEVYRQLAQGEGKGAEEAPPVPEELPPPVGEPPLPQTLGKLTGLFGSPVRRRVEDIADLPSLDERVAKAIPKDVASKLGIVPLSEEESRVWVATLNPHNLVAVDSVSMVFRKRIEVVEVNEVVFQALLDRVYENKALPLEGVEPVQEEEAPASEGEETEARKFVYRMIREAAH